MLRRIEHLEGKDYKRTKRSYNKSHENYWEYEKEGRTISKRRNILAEVENTTVGDIKQELQEKFSNITNVRRHDKLNKNLKMKRIKKNDKQ